MLPIEELRDFKKYQAALRTEIIKSKSKIMPFRYLWDFTYGGDGKQDILVVGKTAPAVLKDIKKECGIIKVEGECRLVGSQLRFKTDGGEINETRLKKLLKAAKIKFEYSLVASFEDGAGEAQHTRIFAESSSRLVDLSNRLAKVETAGESGTLVDTAKQLLTKVRAVIAKEADAPQTGKRLEEILDAAAKGIGQLEKNAFIKGTAGPQAAADAKFEKSSDVSAREIEAVKLLNAVTKQAIDRSQTNLTQILSARKTAMEWQKNEVAIMKANKDQLKKLETKFYADESKLENDIKQAETALEEAEKGEIDVNARMNSAETPGNAKKKMMGEFNKLQKLRKQVEKSLEDLKDDLRKLRKTYSGKKSPFAAGNKHGTARHGAHTGMEQQALRSATGGTTADQDDNEWGDNRDKPELEKVADIDPQRVSFRLGTVAIVVEYETDPNGKRKIKNEAQLLKTVEEIAVGLEGRVAKTSTSSNFLSPELEKEAVDRAIRVAGSCIWDEEWDQQKKDWIPLDRFFVYVGPPKVVKSKGWGHIALRNKDSEGNSVPKMKLIEANKILNAFRAGKIDQDKLMKMMNVSMAKSDDGGVILQPVARVMVDRSGTGWINTSQYPTEDKPGWSLKGKKVRKSRDGGDGITAPEASGVLG
jgi:hypothetical protein